MQKSSLPFSNNVERIHYEIFRPAKFIHWYFACGDDNKLKIVNYLNEEVSKTLPELEDGFAFNNKDIHRKRIEMFLDEILKPTKENNTLVKVDLLHFIFIEVRKYNAIHYPFLNLKTDLGRFQVDGEDNEIKAMLGFLKDVFLLTATKDSLHPVMDTDVMMYFGGIQKEVNNTQLH